MPRATRIAPEQWYEACLVAIADGGPAEVSVERLAAGLGVTKGSFYHHFADRRDLIGRSLQHWRTVATDALIAELEAVDDPLERLRAVLEASFGDRTWGRVDVTLATATDPDVRTVARDVTRRRVDFVTACYVDLGHPEVEARRRAGLAYAAYVGHFLLVEALPELDDQAYVDHVIAALTEP